MRLRIFVYFVPIVELPALNSTETLNYSLNNIVALCSNNRLYFNFDSAFNCYCYSYGPLVTHYYFNLLIYIKVLPPFCLLIGLWIFAEKY